MTVAAAPTTAIATTTTAAPASVDPSAPVSTDASTTIAATVAPSAAPVAAAVDGTAALAAAVAPLDAGYHFTTTATVGGTVAVTADGDRIGPNARFTVTQNAVAANYVMTADGTWVQPDGGDWQNLDTPQATSDPITALKTPTSVAVASSDGTTTTLTVTVTATSLGLPGTDPVNVTVVLTSGAITSVLYQTTSNGQPATVQAAVGPVKDATPIVAPI